MGCPGTPLLRLGCPLNCPGPFFGSLLYSVSVLAASCSPNSVLVKDRVFGGGLGTCQALTLSCEFDWPSFSGSVLSDLFCFYTVQPAFGYQTSRKCLGSRSLCTPCRGPWVLPVTPVHLASSPEQLTPGPECLPSLTTHS